MVLTPTTDISGTIARAQAVFVGILGMLFAIFRGASTVEETPTNTLLKRVTKTIELFRNKR
jgi:hypothetical protein